MLSSHQQEALQDIQGSQYSPPLGLSQTLAYGSFTQAPITKTRTIKMHALDWLNKGVYL